MYPVLFHLGSLPIHSYGVAVGVALFGGALVAVHLGVKAGISASWMWDVALILMFAGVGGARLEYVRTHPGPFLDDPLRIFALRDGGLVFYGGLLAVAVAFFAYARWRRIPVLRLLDIYATILPFSHAIGRLGCFAAGCCFGRPTDLPWAVTFPSGSAAPAGVPLHPTQLYEVAYNLVLGTILVVLRIRGVADGVATALVFMAYGMLRFGNEFLRGDLERGFTWGGLSNAQLTALGLFLVGGIIGWRSRRREIGPENA